MLNIRSHGFGRAQYWYIVENSIKFSEQIGNSFPKIIDTKVDFRAYSETRYWLAIHLDYGTMVEIDDAASIKI